MPWPPNRMAIAGRRLSLRSLCRLSNRRVPVEHPTAAVADHQLALAQLVPHLRAHTHPAASALLILGACQTGTPAGCDAIEAREQLRLDLLPQRIAFRQQRCHFARDLLLPQRNSIARPVQGRGQFFYQRTRCRKRNFLRLGPFQAGKLLGVQAFDLGLGEADFMFNRRSLLGRRHGIQLRTVARCFLPMSGNVALDAIAKRVFPCQRIGRRGCLALRGGKRGFSLRNLRRQGSGSLSQPGPLQVDCLQLYKIFNGCAHPSREVYAIAV